jgi:glycosyltransferase involved in cell wall biosynthesis
MLSSPMPTHNNTRMNARRQILKARAREFLAHDLGALGSVFANAAWWSARALSWLPSPQARSRAAKIMMRLHSGAFSRNVDAGVVDWIRDASEMERRGTKTGLWGAYDDAIASGRQAFLSGARPDPRRLIGSRMLVTKAARPGDRGVLVVDYQYVFPLLAGLFDAAAIAERYDIVLEPSWAGSCTPEILLFSRLDRPVFVQTLEPRDLAFLAAVRTNLQTVPLAANWWADPRHAAPPGAVRDIDVAIVAAWADIKRHWRIFRALAELKARGRRLKVVLAGYRYDRTREDIEQQAAYFGVRDQIETYERITQDEVGALLGRSKIHVLWSRRECANRAIIEAMMADVPVIVREGLTFGHRYAYINEHTGRFVREGDLADAIVEMIDTRERYSPREWVLQNMTCVHATRVLQESLQAARSARGEAWEGDLVVKASTLDTQRYYNPEDQVRFEADYAFLESSIRR